MAAKYEIKTLFQRIQANGEEKTAALIKAADEALTVLLNDGWEILNLTVTSPSTDDFINRVVTLKYEGLLLEAPTPATEDLDPDWEKDLLSILDFYVEAVRAKNINTLDGQFTASKRREIVFDFVRRIVKAKTQAVALPETILNAYWAVNTEMDKGHYLNEDELNNAYMNLFDAIGLHLDAQQTSTRPALDAVIAAMDGIEWRVKDHVEDPFLTDALERIETVRSYLATPASVVLPESVLKAWKEYDEASWNELVSLDGNAALRQRMEDLQAMFLTKFGDFVNGDKS